MNTTSQNNMILFHLASQSITSLEAVDLYGVTRLSGRIYDLKKEGHQIESEMVEVKNRRGDTCHVKRYTLKEEAKI